MSDINLTPKFKVKMNARPRVRGRFNSSELWFINNGRITPEEWLHPTDRSVKELLTMWAGTGTHSQLEDLLGKEHSEKKIEFVYKDIVLVGKADYLPPNKNEVWEFKTSIKLMDKAKPWHLNQVGLYTSMFQKSIGKIYQPVQDDNGIYLKDLGTVKRDDVWFFRELEKLYVFHNKVELLWNQNK